MRRFRRGRIWALARAAQAAGVLFCYPGLGYTSRERSATAGTPAPAGGGGGGGGGNASRRRVSLLFLVVSTYLWVVVRRRPASRGDPFFSFRSRRRLRRLCTISLLRKVLPFLFINRIVECGFFLLLFFLFLFIKIV